jgi:hypothetical protein
LCLNSCLLFVYALDSGHFTKSKIGTSRKGKVFSLRRRRCEEGKKDETGAGKDVE